MKEIILQGSSKRGSQYNKHIVGTLVVLFTILCVTGGLALAQGCDNIRDTDQRYYCRAMQGDKNACMYIRDKDMRYYCQAMTKRDKNACMYISDTDMRNSCRAAFGK
ncbi:MAG: hypothetical protein BWY38_02723 [Ignavibacteria bacterium ADurb.Bin266]|mgnify:CR=1 FL=1|nr:MAG: hypothetical protein BWY38_02723 [Ignavibacteria bacterium ADurb.Bin266]